MECDDAVNALHACKCSEYLNKQNEPVRVQATKKKKRSTEICILRYTLGSTRCWCRALRKPDHNNNTLKCTQSIWSHRTVCVPLRSYLIWKCENEVIANDMYWPKLTQNLHWIIVACRTSSTRPASIRRYDCIWVWPWYLSARLMEAITQYFFFFGKIELAHSPIHYSMAGWTGARTK